MVSSGEYKLSILFFITSGGVSAWLPRKLCISSFIKFQHSAGIEQGQYSTCNLQENGQEFIQSSEPILSYRRFLMPLQQTAFWKHRDKRGNCSKRAISHFNTFAFHFQSLVIHSIIEIFYFLTKYVQSRLLRNCRMRERVKPFPHMTNLQQTTFETYIQKREKSLIES